MKRGLAEKEWQTFARLRRDYRQCDEVVGGLGGAALILLALGCILFGARVPW